MYAFYTVVWKHKGEHVDACYTMVSFFHPLDVLLLGR